MKIIHSSDLHLNLKYPERLDALNAIISLSKSENANLVLVAGDFFDSDREADKLRPSLRDLLSSLPFKILVIPGNHDYKAYRSDLNFGNDVRILLAKPYEIYQTDELKIVAVPYANQNFNDVVPSLEREIDCGRLNILLIHCSLDIPYLKEDEFGDEERQLYLPVSSRVLADIGFDFVFAGHFHSSSVKNKISDKTTFAYSGSPVSITRKEVGKRSVFILDTSLKKAEMLYFKTLGTFYYDEIKFTFSPEKEDEILGELEDKLGKLDLERLKLSITLDGFISMEENEIKEKLKKIIGKYKKYQNNINLYEWYRDVRGVISDPLYMMFKNKLDKKNFKLELKDMINQMVTLQFSQLKFIK